MNLEERAAAAAKDEKLKNELIGEYRNFILSSASKTLNRGITDSDDEFMTAMIAFNEAIDSYDRDKGKFLSFASVIIRNRLIDELRRNSRNAAATFSELENEDGTPFDIPSIDSRNIKWEIEAVDNIDTDSDSDDEDIDDEEKSEKTDHLDKKPDKPEKDIEKNEEFRKELDNIKKIRRENKAEANEVINDLRDIFQDAPKEDRKEILGEIAEIKKELKDDSIGMFMRGKHVDFDKYDGVKPEIVKDRTLIPLRAVSETLGAVSYTHLRAHET